MDEIPVVRMIALALFCSFASGAAGYVVYIRTHENIVATVASMAIVLAVPGFFLMRWWLRVCRAAGVSTTVIPTRKKMLWAVFLFGLMLVAIGLEYLVYGLSGSRPLEFLVAVVLVVPAGLIVFRLGLATLEGPHASEASLGRLTFWLMLLLPILLGAQTLLQLVGHQYAELMPLENFSVAIAFAGIPLMPIAAYYHRARYRAASARAAHSGVSGI